MAALKFRQRHVRRRWVMGLTLTTFALFAVIFVAASGANLPGSLFEGNDGNLVVNTAGNKDWDNAPNLHVGVDLASGQTDNSFGQGTQENDVNVTVVTGSIPNSKADLARFAVASEFTGGSNFLYLAWSRENQAGTVNYDFEINQKTQPDLTTPGPKTLVRTEGDLLINYAFQGGSNTPTLTLRKWTAGGVWGPAASLTGSSEGATNSVTVSDTLAAPAVDRPAQQFGEAAINLTAAGVFPSGTCEAFGSAFVKSRSSTSFTSELKDFIAPVAVNISNCGKIIIKKVTVPDPDPTDPDASFGFTLNGGGNPAPTGVTFPKTFTLTNGQTNETQVFAGSGYSAAETTVPANWVLTGSTCDDGSPVTNIDVSANETVTCTFTNTLQTGAIQVTKTRKHAADGPGSHPHAGVDFTVNGVTKPTDANGVACFDGLTIGSSYSVHETVPAGYHGEADKTVAVDNVAACSDSPYGGESVSFSNTPLTDLSITVNSQVEGGTASTVSCAPDGPGGSTGANGDGTFADTDLEPGTYTCTIAIDP
jgi:hypothetical protein